MNFFFIDDYDRSVLPNLPSFDNEFQTIVSLRLKHFDHVYFPIM